MGAQRSRGKSRGKSKGSSKKSSSRKSKPAACPAPGSAAEQRKWRAESDLRSLREAEAIRGDRGRIQAARQLAKQEARALERIGKT